jgi:hypothetical protein
LRVEGREERGEGRGVKGKQQSITVKRERGE